MLNAFNLNSQFKFNATVGVNYSNHLLTAFPPDFVRAYHDDYNYMIQWNVGLGINYVYHNINFESGFAVNNKGSRVIEIPAGFLGPFSSVYTYYEVPLLVAYKINRYKIECGGGLLLEYRTASTEKTSDDYSRPYGLDIRGFVRYNYNERFSLTGSYTYGNFDKLITQPKGRYHYIHSVFALNLSYNFWISNKLKAKYLK